MNIPFALLSVVFEYPDILRHPTAEVLSRFHAGGPGLIAIWYAFAAAALAFIPVAVLVNHALAPREGRPGSPRLVLSVVAGVGAGFVQALGLLRWVFVVPVLARIHVDPSAAESARTAAGIAFESLHQFAGVGLGEHLGQLGTATWALLIARELHGRRTFARWLAYVGYGSALLIALGLTEGLATVVAFDPGLLAVATPLGYICLSLWMISVGVAFLGSGDAGMRETVGVCGPSSA